MARELQVSVATIKAHLTNLRRKLGAINRTTALALATDAARFLTASLPSLASHLPDD